MIKKFMLSVLAFCFVMLFSQVIYAYDVIPEIYINGQKVDTDNDIVFENSTVYIESDKAASVFGAVLSTDADNNVFTYSNKVRTVTYDSNSGSIIISDRNSFLHRVMEDAYPSIAVDGKKYFPIRMLCYGFHMDVVYDEQSHRIDIKGIYEGVGIFNSEGTAIATNANRYALVNSAGIPLCSFEYDNISNYDNEALYRVTTDHRYGLMNSHGNLLTEIIYDDVIFQSSSAIFLKQGSDTGMCDIYGRILIPVIYDDIVYCANNIAMVKQGDGWHILNFSLGELSEKAYDEVYKITTGIQSDNDMIEGYYVVKNNKWGCVDSFGNVVIDIKYEALDKFDIKGRARVIQNGKFGIIECGGREILPTAYDYVYPYGSLDVTVAKVGNKYGLLNSYGEIVLGFDYDYIYPFNDEISTVAYKNNKFGIISNYGKVISDFEFEYMEEFKDGIALAYRGGYGYVDQMGHEIIKCVHTEIKQGTALSVFMKKDGLFALYSPNGEMLTDYIFTDAGKFSNGLSAVSVETPAGKRYGYVNDSGDEIVAFDYTYASDFKYGKAIVSKGKYSGIIDVDSNTLIPFVYTGFNPSYDYNVIAAADENGNWGLISFNNTKLCDFEYDYIFEFENGYAPVLKEHKYGVIDVNGNLIRKLQYNSKDEAIKGLF